MLQGRKRFDVAAYITLESSKPASKMLVMAKGKQKPVKTETDSPPTSPPSRENYKGTYLPKKLYEQLEKIGKEEERSVAFLVRRAVEHFLEDRRGNEHG